MADVRRIGSAVAVVALVAAASAVLMLATAGPGSRFGVWSYRLGLRLLSWTAYAAIAGMVLGLLAVALGGARRRAAVALVLSLAAFAVPWQFRRRATSVPRIHDITTDTQDPPAFKAALARREGAANPPEYAGSEVAEQQKRAYPDLVPIVLPEPPDRAFPRALEAAKAQGWEIVDADPREGRIEATATTPWFGFKDDVVIRVRPDASGSRVDVRSKSRVGRSDVGANAARIRRFRSALGK